ncbi:hypothetical protein Tco_0905006, partial [Tanacetum coccineum]
MIAPKTICVFYYSMGKAKGKKGPLFIGKEGKDTAIGKLSHDTLQRKIEPRCYWSSSVEGPASNCIEYSVKDKNQAKTDKTEYGDGKSAKSQSQHREVKVKDEAGTEEILNGPTRTHLMGR